MRYFLFILLFSLFTACKKDRKCIKSLGERNTEVRSASLFNEISVSDKIDIVLQPSSVNEIIVEAGENMLPFISTKVEGTKLIIGDNNKCDFLRSYKKNKIQVTVKYIVLDKLFLESAGSITCTDTLRFSKFFIEARGSSGDIDLKINGDTLKIAMHTGTSNVNLTGKTYKTEVYSGGNGIFKMENLISQVILSNNSGTGDFYLHATNYLFALIHLLGDVYYKGTPNIDLITEGSGKLIQL